VNPEFRNTISGRATCVYQSWNLFGSGNLEDSVTHWELLTVEDWSHVEASRGSISVRSEDIFEGVSGEMGSWMGVREGRIGAFFRSVFEMEQVGE